uniref:Putative conserved plasma membrane protein n=1 Tax=Culex tarsalis TaxID=7177 RepID=A0A1Q3FTN0_CULTA
MADFLAFPLLFLVTFAVITSCDENVANFCKHIKCTKVDKDCTKPLKPQSYCWCQTVEGKLELKFGTCFGAKVFNGKNDKCEEDSKSARAYCKKKSGSG